MVELTKGTQLRGEGGGKDRVLVKHGRRWRYRTTQVDALATFAPTRGAEPTAPMGGGYCISVVGLDEAGKVERGPDGKPLPLSTMMLTIDADALAKSGFDPAKVHLAVVHEAINAAAVRRSNLQKLNSFCERMVTQIPDLVDTPPALDGAATSPEAYDGAIGAATEVARQAVEPVSDAAMSTQAKGPA